MLSTIGLLYWSNVFILTVNAADNKQRDKSMNCIKINIDVWVICNTARPIKILKVYYATFSQAVNKQKNGDLDTRNSSLQELTWL